MPRSFKAKKVVVSCEKLGGRSKHLLIPRLPNGVIQLARC